VHRGRVVAFLSSSLKITTQAMYQRELEYFSNEMVSRGVDWTSLREEDLDWTIADFLVERYESTCSSQGLASAASLVAAIVKRNPRIRLTVSWKCLDLWRQKHPPVQAPAMPKALHKALINCLLIANQPVVAAVVVVTFDGVLRASECLKLTAKSFLRTAGAYVAILGVTKRGMDQKVVLTNVATLAWLDAYFDRYPMAPEGKTFDISYNRLNYWLRRGSQAFGFGHLRWSSHSLRRGGATAMVLDGHPFKDVQVYGRWLSERSCREYLRKGEVAMLKAEANVDEDSQRLVAVLGAMGADVFKLLPK